MSDHGNSLIRTPRQLLTVIVLAFVVPVILIILLATFVVRSATSGVSGSDAMSEKAIGERMRQVGVVAFADAGAANYGADTSAAAREQHSGAAARD